MNALGRAPDALLAAGVPLLSPDDITLTWKADAPDAPDPAGWVVEFATEREGRYTILDFVPPSQTTFTHPDLMPEARSRTSPCKRPETKTREAV